MSNMSYCRFENTLADLADCVEALDDMSWDLDDIESELSSDEFRALRRLVGHCVRVAEQMGDDV